MPLEAGVNDGVRARGRDDRDPKGKRAASSVDASKEKNATGLIS
jgi:hypothetical protein